MIPNIIVLFLIAPPGIHAGYKGSWNHSALEIKHTQLTGGMLIRLWASMF